MTMQGLFQLKLLVKALRSKFPVNVQLSFPYFEHELGELNNKKSKIQNDLCEV